MKLVNGRHRGKMQQLEPGDRLPGAGHPGGHNFKTVAAKYLKARMKKKNPLNNELENLSGMERLAITLFNIMENSDSDMAKIAAIREILDRFEGKVSQGIDLSMNEKAEKIAAMFPTEEELREMLDEPSGNS